MTNRETLYRGTSCVAWGYFFLYFDLNLGTVSILPRFAGYLMFLSAISHLSAEQRDLALLRPLGILLTLWHGINWLTSWSGITLDGYFLPADLVVSVISLYFHFQLFTDLSALAAKYQQPGQELDRKFLHYRTLQTLLITVTSLTAYLPEGDVQRSIVLLLTIISFLVCLRLMGAAFTLRKLFREDVSATS